MRSLQWTPEHSVFLPEIDAEHQAMFRLVQDLRHAALGGSGPDTLMHHLRRVSEEFTAHFQHEERLMRASRYPSTGWHKAQHGAARSKLIAVRGAIRTGDRQVISHAVECVADWIRDHTSVADRMFGAYVRNHDRVRAAS